MSLTIIRRMATVKRFYKRTDILSSGNKFEIVLDQRKLKTPRGKLLEVDNKTLALAVAAEWEAQKGTIDKSSMHLTALCNTTIDNPNNYAKQDMVSYIVNCLETDTILFQSYESDELYNLQVQEWDPLIQWFCDHYHTDIIKTQSIEAPSISPQTKEILTKDLMSYNYNAVYGLLYGTDTLKSVILMLATVKRALCIKDAVRLSRLEEEYQIAHWGSVEWCHELNKQDSQARLSAAILFVHLNSYSATTRSKDVGSQVRS